jgi:hypothetical protein
MAERQALEQKMDSLTGGADSDPRTAALYQVRPMAERRAEHDVWQRQREQEAERLRTARIASREEASGERALPREPERPTLRADDAPPLRSTRGEGPPGLRPTAAERRRERPGAGLVDGLRDQLGRVASLQRSLDDADRQLADRGMNAEREDLQRMRRDTGVDRLASGAQRLDEVFDRAAPTRSAPERAERVIEDDWLARRDAVGGPDLARYQQGFKERAERLFGVETGTIDRFQERMERLRSSSLARRRDAREAERSDEARRNRALERRREGSDER